MSREGYFPRVWDNTERTGENAFGTKLVWGDRASYSRMIVDVIYGTRKHTHRGNRIAVCGGEP